MLAISNTFDTASIHAAGSTSWLDERTTSARRAPVEPARRSGSSCKRGIRNTLTARAVILRLLFRALLRTGQNRLGLRSVRQRLHSC